MKKRILSFTLCLTLILCSFSFCFADFGTTDSNNLASIKNALTSGGVIYNFLNTISGRLYQSNQSIAYWVKGIYDNTWINGVGGVATIANNINNKLTTTNSLLSDIEGWFSGSNGMSALLNQILAQLAYTDTGGALKSWLSDIWQNTENIEDIYNLQNYDGNLQYFKNLGTIHRVNYNRYGNSNSPSFPLNSASIEGHLFNFIWGLNNSFVNYALDAWNQNLYLYDDYSAQQTAINWGTLGNAYFTPTSSTDGIYKWLGAIQAPVARLSYVLASDERIAAQEAAAPVEQAVVDDFIDPQGDASASTSDIGSIADLSAGYKQNFGSTASVTGIFDIFNSNNMGWFSSETHQQLDTTVQVRGSSFETPLLDRQLEEINSILGVNNND